MFGENEIIGQTTIKVNKRRIVLPEFTFREPDDELLLMYGLLKEKLIIGHIVSMEIKLNQIEEALISSNYKKDENKLKRIRDIRRLLYGSRCIEETKIDQQKRILIPKKVIETLDFEKEVFAVGHEDRLDIYKDEATYLKLKNDH